jgi:hypothetical protein
MSVHRAFNRTSEGAPIVIEMDRRTAALDLVVSRT